MPALVILIRPPTEQNRETLGRRLDRPVELRREVISPTVLKPQTRVGVELVVGIQTSDLFWKSRPPNSKGTDPKLHIGLLGLDPRVERVHEFVHILPSPFGSAQTSAASQVLLPISFVGKVDEIAARILLFVRIKVVVNVHAVDVVPADNVDHDGKRMLLRGPVARIEPALLPISTYPSRMRTADVIGRWFGLSSWHAPRQ